MKCNHEWYQGKCVHCEVTPIEAREIETLRSELEQEKRTGQIIADAHKRTMKRAEQAEARVKELESFIETAEYSELYDALQAIALLGKHGCIVADDCPICIAKQALKGDKNEEK